jgi:hypothetical protein
LASAVVVLMGCLALEAGAKERKIKR